MHLSVAESAQYPDFWPCVFSACAAFPFSSEQWSFAGFVTAIKAFDISAFAGIIYIVGASLWTLEALFSLWVLKDVSF